MAYATMMATWAHAEIVGNGTHASMGCVCAEQDCAHMARVLSNSDDSSFEFWCWSCCRGGAVIACGDAVGPAGGGGEADTGAVLSCAACFGQGLGHGIGLLLPQPDPHRLDNRHPSLYSEAIGRYWRCLAADTGEPERLDPSGPSLARGSRPRDQPQHRSQSQNNG